MNRAVLHWSYRDFQKIPDDLLQYDEFLEEIYLKENHITTIPLWLFQLTNLRFIHLSGNSISELPDDIFLLENLEFLDVSNNKLKALPKTFGKLFNLQRFNISGNEISVLPKCIGQLKKLESIDLSANLLRSVPTEIGECSELYEVILNDNLFLQILPNNLTRLKKLETLCADRCGLLYLPLILSNSLTHIRLFNNTFVTHIPIVYKKHIRRFYEVIHPSCDSIPHNTGCIVIQEEETLRKLLLPFNTREVFSHKNRKVFTLFDHCLKVLGNYEKNSKLLKELPKTILEYVKSCPIGVCSNEICKSLLYSEYVFVVVKRLNSSSSLIFSCNFCSSDCATGWLKSNNTEYYSVDWNFVSKS